MKSSYKFFILCFFIVVGFGIYHYYGSSGLNNFDYDTKIVVPSLLNNEFYADSFVVRNELIMGISEDKMVNYFVQDGEKVVIGASIANLYDNDMDFKSFFALENIQDQLQLLSRVKLLRNNKNLTSEVIYNQIISNIGDYIDLANKKIFDDLQKQKNELFVSLIKRNLIFGPIKGLDEKIKELQSQAAEYNNVDHFNLIYSPATGFFCNKIDGFESYFLVDDLFNFDYNDFASIFQKKPKKIDHQKYIGKIIKDFDWYIILKTDKKILNKLRGYNFIEVDFDISDLKTLPAQIIDIKEANNKKDIFILLKSNYLSKSILKLRHKKVKVFTKSVYGLPIDIDAIRFKDGQKGVFVQEDREVIFKKIDPLFETDTIIISQLKPLDNDYLQAFDEVILNGQVIFDDN